MTNHRSWSLYIKAHIQGHCKKVKGQIKKKSLLEVLSNPM